MSLFERNLELFLKRYPEHIFFLRGEGSSEDNFEEHGIEDFEGVDNLYIFGLGLSRDYNFFKKRSRGSIIFIEERIDRLQNFLKREDADKVLKDRDCHICFNLFLKDEQFLKEIADSFSSSNIKIINGGYEKGRFSELKGILKKRIFFSSALYMSDLYYHHIFKNIVKNLQHLPRSFFANNFKDSFKDIPAIVIGAGPSLFDDIEVLKRVGKKALLIAGGSAIAALSKNNVRPHFGVAIDPNVDEFSRFMETSLLNMPILYTTRVNPDIFKTFSSDVGYLKSTVGGMFTNYLEKRLGIDGEIFDRELGWDALSVTTLNIAFSKFLGCRPIVLCGVDLAYTGMRRYSDGLDVGIEDDGIVKREGKGGLVYTNLKWIMESDSISRYSKGCEIIDATSGGLGFQGIPFKRLEELEREFKGERDIRGYINLLIEENRFDIDKKRIDCEIEELRGGFLRCLKNIDIIIGEIEGLRKKRKRKRTAKMILAIYNLEGEYVYNHLLKKSKRAADSYVFKKSKVERELQRWCNLKEVASLYMKYIQG